MYIYFQSLSDTDVCKQSVADNKQYCMDDCGGLKNIVCQLGNRLEEEELDEMELSTMTLNWLVSAKIHA